MSLSGGDFYFRGQVQTGFWQFQHPIRRETGIILAEVSDRGIILNIYFMLEFPSLYYIKNQQDTTLAVLFISNCKITLHVSDALCANHKEYLRLC
jgi:hypothetical protein